MDGYLGIIILFSDVFWGSQARTNGIYDSDGTYQQ
jgi:hypothetical protein